MRRSVVHDPEHRARFVVGRLAHHLVDQPSERRNASAGLAAPEHLHPVYVQCGQIRPGAPRAYSCSTRMGLPAPAARLGCMRKRAWMLVFSSVDTTNSSSRSSRPCQLRAYRSRMRADLAWNCGSRREDPAAVLPGPDRVLVQPAPYRAIADARHQSAALGLPRHVGHAQTRQGHPQAGRQLTGQRLDLNGDLWGEKPGGDRGGRVPPSPPIVPCRSAFATH